MLRDLTFTFHIFNLREVVLVDAETAAAPVFVYPRSPLSPVALIVLGGRGFLTYHTLNIPEVETNSQRTKL